MSYTEETNCAQSLYDCIVFDSRDWGLDARDAWIYGIVVGWGSCIDEVAKRHRWREVTVKRLQELHREFDRNYKRSTTTK